MKQRSRIIFFYFIAILMLSEMITSNLYSLVGPLEDTAEFMGITVAAERIRLVILIVLDAIPGVGAVLAIRAYRHSVTVGTGRIGVLTSTLGMLAYGGYQLWSAMFLLGNRQSFVTLVGVVYATLGLVTWLVGSDLRQVTKNSFRD
ncbi:MAG: hypothetical protein CL799_05205 [Chromatiales bacterium]|jgi:hypothetical protein|nr:hypothetical protein [Chromatiales bacterium]